MLRILLDATDGGTAWRHALADGEARAGWECAGPLALARRLGRLYGVRGEPAPHAERVSAYAARLALLDDGARSFSASRAKDPFGVAAFLLGLRDLLRAAGWDGRALDGSPRLVDLAAAERLDVAGLCPLPRGLADVYAELLAEIDRAPSLPEPLDLRIAAPDAALDAILHRVLAALALKGASVEPLGAAERAPCLDSGPLRGPTLGTNGKLAPEATDLGCLGTNGRLAAAQPTAPETTDLGRLQRALLSATRTDASTAAPPLAADGSVLVLEADSPLEAAELTAAYLRARPLAAATLVLRGDANAGALQAALARHALPALGAGERSRWRPGLQILPLRLALAFAPQDPFRAAELLTLAVSPIPRRAARLLLDALVEQPGIGSPAWLDAIDEAAAPEAERAEAADDDAETRLRERLETWFGGPLHDPREGIPTSEAMRLCELVARWAETRAHATDARDPLDAQLRGAAHVARTLARLLSDQPPGTRLGPVQLEQLHDVAAGAGLDGAALPGEAGRPAIAPDPGAVLPGAREVIWWGFLGGDPGPAPAPWTAAERAALASRGVHLPEPGALRDAEAVAWRQPILAARDRLVLVRWRLDGAAPTVAHPLADELAARFERALAPVTVTSDAALAGTVARFETATSDRAPAAEIAPRAVFNVPPDLVSTDRLSPSSLEKLLGCPVAWVLEHAAGLRRRGMARIPSGSRLLGTFAHAVLEDLLHGPEKLDLATATPDEAASWAGRAFDARVGREAAPLVAHGAEVQRHRAREVVCEAARSLFALLQDGGWRVRGVEEALTGKLDGVELGGYADLVLEKGGAPAVLDLKLARQKYFREKLQKGEALQVALYADMTRRNGVLPPTGYFMIGQGELLTVDRGAFPGARELPGPSMQDTLDAARDALRFWRAALRSGVVASRRDELREASELEAGEAAGSAAPARGPGAMDAPCKYCEYDAVCAVELREVAR